MTTSQTKTIMAFVDQFLDNNSDMDSCSLIEAWNDKKPAFETLIKAQFKNKAPKTDPAKPKRPVTTYQLYMTKHRQEVVDDGYDQKEVMGELARRYNVEKEEETEEYLGLVEVAQTDKDRYTEEMKSYTPTPGFEPKRKDPNAPKRPKSAYNIFCEETRASVKEENPEMTQPEIMSELGRMWKELGPDDDETERLNELAADDKERYKKEMESYVRPPEDELPAPRKRVGSGGKSKKTGPLRATSAYMFFRKERYGKLTETGMSTKEVADEVIAEWNELKQDEERLEVYSEMAAKDKVRYEKEKAEWDAKNGTQSQSDDSGDDQPKKGKAPRKQLGMKKPDTPTPVRKEPLTAKSNAGYIAFCKANRAKMKQEKPDLVGKELTKQLQVAWKKIGAKKQSEWA